MIRLYEGGCSDVEVCKAIKLPYNEFNSKCRTDSLFAELVDYGRLAAQAWWYELGRKGATGEKNFNYSAWYAVMKNRYGWSDRVEAVASEGIKPLDQMGKDEITAELAARAAQLAKFLGPTNVVLAAQNLDEPSELA